MSDWGATHSGYLAANSGEDMDMPGWIDEPGSSFFGGNITHSVRNGSLTEVRLDDMCRRIMTPYFQLGENSWPETDGSEPALNFNTRTCEQGADTC